MSYHQILKVEHWHTPDKDDETDTLLYDNYEIRVDDEGLFISEFERHTTDEEPGASSECVSLSMEEAIVLRDFLNYALITQ